MSPGARILKRRCQGKDCKNWIELKKRPKKASHQRKFCYDCRKKVVRRKLKKE
jgi:hypothetical protein